MGAHSQGEELTVQLCIKRTTVDWEEEESHTKRGIRGVRMGKVSQDILTA